MSSRGENGLRIESSAPNRKQASLSTSPSRREHQDEGIGVAADFLAEVEAVAVGEREVENDDVCGVDRSCSRPLAIVVAVATVWSFGAERRHDELCIFRRVFDNEHPGTDHAEVIAQPSTARMEPRG